MSAKILDGNLIAAEIKQGLKKQLASHLASGLRRPGFAVIIVGDDPASKIYVEKKCASCHEVGFIAKDYALPTSTTEENLITLISELNIDPSIDGILVQLPLPAHIQLSRIVEKIDPAKDVDGFHPYNFGRLAIGSPVLSPCTSKGIMTLLKRSLDCNFQSMEALVVGHSNLVGKPMALELLAANATVTVCHVFTKELKTHIAQADLLIVAVGKPELIKGDWIKKQAIVVDVGINRLPDGKIVGDVEFATAKERASWITKVPGGVGPMTVAALLENVWLAATSKVKICCQP